MRTNKEKYHIKKRIVINTPLYNKVVGNYERGQSIPFDGVELVVVDASRISGTDTVEFYMKKVG